ncbi:uncharacterized protein METZ01_LOCUS281334 [marine metagenome]|uniref:D-sedoheptulose-7-phosphate isomerase n=1 Tax=marine metagenome TaxID=408172 RepID=A0A382KVJ0_9ZZZZ
MIRAIDKISAHIQESINAKSKLLSSREILENLEEASSLLIKILQTKGKIMLIGNGGSAADSQHLAAEFITRLNFDRGSLPAIALSTDTSVLTAISNDYDFTSVFSRQIEAIGNEGDALISISTSGQSANIVKAAQIAKDKNIKIISLIGSKESKLHELSDIVLTTKVTNTARIQEIHILYGHILCSLVEESIFKNDKS